MKKSSKSKGGLFGNLRKSSRSKKAAPSINAQHKRPRGRPPKHSQWDSNSGQYVKNFVFPKDIVKAANERLRKLEKVHKWNKDDPNSKSLAESSEIYLLMMKYKDSYHNTKGKIYKSDKSGNGVRFINKTEFDKLSDDDKEYFIERLIRFMESASSTNTGIKAAHKQSYGKFMEKYGKKYPDLTYEQYSDLFAQYNSKNVNDANTHFTYTDLTKALFNIRIDVALRDKQFDSIMTKIHSGKKKDWNDIPSEYKLRK